MLLLRPVKASAGFNWPPRGLRKPVPEVAFPHIHGEPKPLNPDLQIPGVILYIVKDLQWYCIGLGGGGAVDFCVPQGSLENFQAFCDQWARSSNCHVSCAKPGPLQLYVGLAGVVRVHWHFLCK